jgi:uncharacterized RDD family membrane protein YckC
MSPELRVFDPVPYAAFKLRFRALIIDAVICTGLFLIGAIVAGITFENSAGARVVTFGVLLAVILCYEPLMVARYGGTIGHRKSNIRIVCSRSYESLPLWRAATRSILKDVFGVISFIFVFATNRAQSLHDLAAGARVILRDPLAASEDDAFAPVDTRTKKIVVILIYNVSLVLAVSAITQLAVSNECANREICSDFETLLLKTVRAAWVTLAGLSIILGWKELLPGLRPRS